jgi:hypothetical protein
MGVNNYILFHKILENLKEIKEIKSDRFSKMDKNKCPFLLFSK